MLHIFFQNRARIIHRSISKVFGYKFDLVVSNPPYVVNRDIRCLSDDIKRYEPRSALDGGNDGLDVIRKVIYKSKYLLKNKGLLAIEIGNGQYDKVSKILGKSNFVEYKKEYDYKNNVRCILSSKY